MPSIRLSRDNLASILGAIVFIATGALLLAHASNTASPTSLGALKTLAALEILAGIILLWIGGVRFEG